MSWTVTIGQAGADPQERISDIIVTEEFGMVNFSVTIMEPTTAERNHFKGRKDDAIIQIKRGSDVVAEGFIEDVEYGSGYVKYTGRSFLILLGYSTASKTTQSTGETEAEYKDDIGKDIIDDLIDKYCITKDNEIVKNIIFLDKYGGLVKLHGKKVYQIVKEMCQMYGYDLWSTTTWVGNDITQKIINVGMRERGDSLNEYTTLYGGRHFRDIPIVRNRSSQSINCLRVIGGGTGKDKVSVFVEDETPAPDNSIENYGYIEGEPYHNNMIRSVETAQSVGQAIITAKKDPIEQIKTDLIIYMADLQYGDWIRVVDTHTGLDVIRRVKRIVRIYNHKSIDRMQIELGSAFDNYQNIINDLTKGDVDAEPDMTMAGGSLKMTANDPPSEYVRIDPGTWYGTDGQPHERTGGSTAAWLAGSGTFPTGSGGYRKAVVQIADDTHSITSAFGAIVATADLAEATVLSADSGNIPIGIVILRQAGSADKISDVYEVETDNKSYIYLDARPIIGSSASGYGGEGRWAVTTDDTWTASTAYVVGDWIGPTVANDRSYKCTTAGTSGGTEPTWGLTVSGTTSDGTCVFTCYYTGIVVDSIDGITDLDVHVTPIGNGVIYLG